MSSTLTSLITDDHVILRGHPRTWKEAVESVAEPLIADGSIEPRYVQSMIEAVERFGPYIVLTPHLALAHARPEGGVHKQAMSVMTLAEPVEFGHDENDPVDIIFCLAAVDNSSHLQALRDFVSIAGNRELQERLIGATTIQDFQRVLRAS